ncbi:hypothetical protein [Robertkochia sediminum]|uniref:hypothetical protein n=1 Tax=Robertkochia sediminum TaxID=2785326 RepID=UPI00193257EF|nr:hypothetical protein [Robertkochia sediminum]MBL7472189.1 hypothetical protein [Robertkochia sediminum]
MKAFKSLKISYLCIALLAAGSIAGCSKDTLDDIGSGTSTLEISASLVPPTQSKSRETVAKFAGNLNFNAGHLWVSEIEFDGTLVRGTSIERQVERFSKFDFNTGMVAPPMNDIVIPSGDYSYVNIEVELRDEDAQPAIMLVGTYVRTDGTSSPIRFEFNSGETFEAETEQTMTMEEGTTVFGSIVLDPYVWFSNVPVAMLDNAKTNGQGIILINEENNEEIYDLVEDGLDESTESEFSN